MTNNGTYGTKRPAFISSSDVDIFYSYRPNRNTDSPNFPSFKKMSSDCLSSINSEDEYGNDLGVLPGLYNLKLPLQDFSTPGIYTVYIKPKEISAVISDVSTLAAYPNVKGIVIDTSNISVDDNTIFNNGGLVGYRVEYFSDTNSSERLPLYRLITSSNKCEPLSQNLNNSMQKGAKYYRFNDSSNLLFCTLTPSTSMSFKSSSTPYIGKTGQSIRLINTKFNPIMLELELVEHDIETVSTMLEGDQLRNLNSGLITTFNSNGEIYHQASYGHIVNTNTNLNADYKMKHSEIYSEEKSKMEEVKNNA